MPVLEPREPEVTVCLDVSRFVQVTSVPTTTTSSSRMKFSTSEVTFPLDGGVATTGADASGVGADAVGSGVGTDVAVGAGAGSELQAVAARAINAAAASPIRDFRRRLTLGLLGDRIGGDRIGETESPETESSRKELGLGSDVLPFPAAVP